MQYSSFVFWNTFHKQVRDWEADFILLKAVVDIHLILSSALALRAIQFTIQGRARDKALLCREICNTFIYNLCVFGLVQYFVISTLKYAIIFEFPIVFKKDHLRYLLPSSKFKPYTMFMYSCKLK